MKILISAFACAPNGSAEDQVGWRWVEDLARTHELWVMTNSDRRAELEEALRHHPLPGVHWIYQDIPRWLRFATNRESSGYIHYFYWHICAVAEAKFLHLQNNFDVGHHITFVQYWSPTFLARMPFPFVWGPVGGGEGSPLRFYGSFGVRGILFECVRDVIRCAAYLRPGVRANARALVSFATTNQTAERLRSLGAGDVRVAPAIRLSRESFERLASIPIRHTKPFRVAGAGRLLHWKGFHLGIKAFARFSKSFPQAEYWIAGRGPDERRLRALAESEGVGNRVKWLGHVSAEGVVSLLEQSDVLIHPSLHDSGGQICLESMAAGRPVVCLALGGPGAIVTPESGHLVPADHPKQAIAGLADALEQLALNPEHRAALAAAGRRRVRDKYVWGGSDVGNELIYNELSRRLAVGVS
jgi:glycosyltransferase involved in cell wall biosynthesis